MRWIALPAGIVILGWTLLDATVCLLAISLLGLSLWAIRWVAALGRA